MLSNMALFLKSELGIITYSLSNFLPQTYITHQRFESFPLWGVTAFLKQTNKA